MRRFYYISLAVLPPVAVGICIAAVRSGSEIIRSATPNTIIVPRDELDFGTVWEQTQFLREFRMVNTSPATIVITGWNTSCRCITVAPEMGQIAPNGEARFRATFDLVDYSKAIPQTLTSPVSVSITPRLSSPDIPSPIFRFSGTVRRLLTLSQHELHLYGPNQLVRGLSSPNITVAIKSQIPLDELQASCPSNYALAKITNAESNGTDYDLVIQPNPNLPVGLFEFVITLIPIHQHVALPSRAIAVSGSMIDAVQPFPDTVVLGTVPVGHSRTVSVSLASRTNETFDVDSIDCGLATMKVVPVNSSQQQAANYTYNCTLVVTAPGADESTIHFHIVDGVGVRFSVNVRVFWYGIETERR